MTQRTRLFGLSGSLRHRSFNAALLRTAIELMPPDSELVVGSIRGIPLYDGDIEAADGVPPIVAEMKEAIVAADGVLLVTPEYNNSIPGVFKNAIDWLSRPSADIKRVFGDRPFAITGASPGNFGTTSSQTAWLPVMRTLGVRQWFGGRLMIARAATVFDDGGVMIDEASREHLRQFLAGFVAFVRERPRR